VRLRLEVANPNILDGRDPLFTKIFINNATDGAVRTRSRFACRKGTIAYEVRPDPAATFRPTFSMMHGMSAGFGGPTIELSPGATVATYGIISYEHASKAPFLSPGSYELRAVVYDTPGITGASEPVKIEVHATVRGDVGEVPRARILLVKAMISAHVKAADIEAARKLVTLSSLPETTGWTLPLAELREAASDDDRAAILAELDAVRRELPPVTAEIVSWQLAGSLSSIRQYDLARKACKQLDERSYERASLEENIRQNERDDPLAKKK
jgi:hypothetical protein